MVESGLRGCARVGCSMCGVAGAFDMLVFLRAETRSAVGASWSNKVLLGLAEIFELPLGLFVDPKKAVRLLCPAERFVLNGALLCFSSTSLAIFDLEVVASASRA